jgi:hypothetical protein
MGGLNADRRHVRLVKGQPHPGESDYYGSFGAVGVSPATKTDR